MKPNITYKEDDYKRANKYLRLTRIKKEHENLATPDVIYKLSLMALDKLTASFLSFYGVAPKDFGTVALLKEVQEIVYIDDALVDILANIIERQDRVIKENKHIQGIERMQANFLAALVREIYNILSPYLPM